ncbi:amidohydrolase family protein [Leptogranulimonas caecicola]|uniref:Amidohydrolase n=1 Tax=Leptogranulimonas caecicola TaxID=2894156 RepID=A0AAU9C551_9ACTN|nr:amidohydrolase family protein [Leptogranulimonas caecicola]BDC91425.1 amidohydrolase [Leptogranulimonas caecicola]
MALQLIDAHFHVWDLDAQELPWLEGTDGSITHTYTLEELEVAYAAIGGVDFLGGVYVEVDGVDPLLEDRLTWERMSQDPKILATMMRARVEPWMRLPVFATGVREPLHIGSQPKDRALAPNFIAGLRVLAGAGKPFESCNRVEDLPIALEAFSQVPEATAVLNHLGNVTPESFTEDYRATMASLAQLPNLYLKVSGFPTADKDFATSVLTFVKETFDPARLLYASNWPVVGMYSSLAEHLASVREVFGDDERLFCENACDCYGIQL